jgi:hypothetical protein
VSAYRTPDELDALDDALRLAITANLDLLRDSELLVLHQARGILQDLAHGEPR